MLKLLGALAVVALGVLSGYRLTMVLLAARAGVLVADAPGTALATPVAAPGGAPRGKLATAGGCCTEEAAAHARPRGQTLPTEGIHGAAARGDLPAVRAALDGGADVDVRDAEGRTPLAVAVVAGRLRVLRLLLDRGADPEIPDRRHASPLMLAAGFGDTAMIDALLAYGASAEGADDDGRTALMLAAEGGHVEAIEMLFERGVRRDRHCSRGMTALMYAVAADRRSAVETLIRRGAEKDARDARGATPLAIAAEHARLELAARLLDAGADIDAADHEGLTPLAYAALRSPPLPGRQAVAELLASRGASFELGLVAGARARIDEAALAALATRHGRRLVISDGQPASSARAEPAKRQLLHAVTRQRSRGLPPRMEQRLVAFQRNRWRVANVIARVEIRNLQARPGQHVSLAGDAAGRADFYFDDALLFEAYGGGTHKLATDFLGDLEALRVDGDYAQPLIRRGRFRADELDLTRYFQGAQRVVITAIDWGGMAALSDVFIRLHGKDAERVLRLAEIREVP